MSLKEEDGNHCIPLEAPPTFPFPFPPYDIQENFMKALFETLEQGKLGIFESPTGTGKSLSLICGALTWFLEHEKRRILELEEKLKSQRNETNDDDDWFAAATQRLKLSEEKVAAKKELDMLKSKAEKMADLRRRRKSIHRQSVQQQTNEFDELFKDCQDVQKAVKKELEALKTGTERFDEEEEDLILEEYFSDDDEDKVLEQTEEQEDYSTRIFYCSRTHSQLAQFVKEIQKSPFSDSIRLVSLASRKNMCINPQVQRLGSSSLINERCLELQKKKDSKKNDKSEKGKKSSSCQFHKQAQMSLLSDQALLQVMDIEEIVSEGKRMKGCPYYASRFALKDAQIVILPYNTLLHKPTRDTLGIDLKRSVVIIDEAHNILDTISHIHSVEISGKQLCKAHSQLQQYCNRYKSRLKAKNLLYIKQILFVLSNLVKILGGKVSSEPEEQTPKGRDSKLVKPETLMDEAQIFNLDIFKLMKYIEKSKIVQKLHGFSENYQEGKVRVNEIKKEEKKKGVTAFLKSLENLKDGKYENDGTPEEASKTSSQQVTISSPLQIFHEFISALSRVSHEARILVSVEDSIAKSSIKYCLLDPSTKFVDLVSECRSIIVAGGTMQPISEFQQRLFISAGADKTRVTHFSCGHVVDKENILPLVIGKGPTGQQLDFSFANRSSPKVLDELFRTISNLINVIPGGIVIFFPSYEYENKVHSYFDSQGYLSKIALKKQVYREPKNANAMDKVLRSYSQSARVGQGAVLLSVVGGKMSEGINFSDDLGRAVVMVGLPYPNAYSLELKEKMAYLNQTVKELEDGRSAGQVHYENLCMKAVNQSIGRAIRHRNDYAAILLLDHRYQRPTVVKQLPGWISKEVKIVEKFPAALSNVVKFFKAKKSSIQN